VVESAVESAIGPAVVTSVRTRVLWTAQLARPAELEAESSETRSARRTVPISREVVES
jgi:hypothetical protein